LIRCGYAIGWGYIIWNNCSRLFPAWCVGKNFLAFIFQKGLTPVAVFDYDVNSFFENQLIKCVVNRPRAVQSFKKSQKKF